MLCGTPDLVDKTIETRMIGESKTIGKVLDVEVFEKVLVWVGNNLFFSRNTNTEKVNNRNVRVGTK